MRLSLILLAALAVLLLIAGAVVWIGQPVDHTQCPNPENPEYWDCDWWPRK